MYHIYISIYMAPPLSKEQEAYLHQLYYDKNNFFGRDKLYYLVKQDKQKISRRQVMEWLKKQHTYQLYKPTKQRKDIARTVLDEPYKQIGIDLIDVQNIESNGYKYILTAIDLFSKYAWAEPLKNKNNKTVLDGFKKIIKRMKKKPRSIRSDNGSEFINDSFKKYLKNKNITQVLSKPSTPQSNGQIERFNQILKRMLSKLMNIKREWTNKDIQHLTNSYNNVYQRIIKTTPAEAIQQNKNEEIHKNIKDTAYKNDKQKVLFEKGDKVRVKLNKPMDNGQLWTDKIYTIRMVARPRKLYQPYYFIKGSNKKFYNNDLQLIKDVDNEKDNKEDYYEVSRLIRPSIENNIPGYIVRWKYYPKKSDWTWQAREQLLKDIPKIVRQFDKKHKIKWYRSKNRWKYTFVEKP